MSVYASTACLKNKYIKESVEQLARAGFKYVELSGGTEYYSDLWDDLRELQDEYDITYACHAYFPPPKEHFVVNLASCNDDIYERSITHYEKCINKLEIINCNVLSIHAGFLLEITPQTIGKLIPADMVYNEDEAYKRFCTAYNYLLKICKAKDIRLYLENNVLSAENYKSFGEHNYFMMTDYDSIMRMKAVLDFDLLLDLGHLHVSSNTLGLKYDSECKKLAEYAKWCHISHNNGVLDQHKPLVDGCIEVSEYIKRGLSNVPTTLETVGDWDDLVSSRKVIAER